MNLLDEDLGCVLLCDVCESEITLVDDVSNTGCCAACGIAYVFDLVAHVDASVSA